MRKPETGKGILPFSPLSEFRSPVCPLSTFRSSKTMKSLFLTNRFTPSEDGWFLLVPKGEHPWQSDDGKDRVLQVVDDAAVASIVNRFNAGGEELLVDCDHLSHDRKNKSEAMAWIDSLENRDGSVWAHAKWTDLGEPAIKSRRYRFISPVTPRADVEDLGGGRMRLLAVSDAGLTNQPNMPVPPILNREQGDAWLGNSTNKTNMQLKPETVTALLAKLGVQPADGADIDAQVLAALEKQTTQEETTEMCNRVSALEDLLANRDLDVHGITDKAKREKFLPLLIANRDSGLGFLEEIAAAGKEVKAPAGVLHNRAAARPPGQAAAAPVKNRAQQQREAISAERINNRSHEEAYYAAKAKHPDMFLPETEQA